MEYVIGLIIAIIVVGVLWFSMRDKPNKAPAKGKSIEPEYTQFLSVMETVFKGGDKNAQTAFLSQQQTTIKKYLKFDDFDKKFNQIIKLYGK